MKLPTIESYYPYSSDNYGANSLKLEFENLTLYYSYKTIIAFRAGNGLAIRKNDWSSTTGKHLNAIDDDKSRRIDGEEFERQLLEVLKEKGLSQG